MHKIWRRAAGTQNSRCADRYRSCNPCVLSYGIRDSEALVQRALHIRAGLSSLQPKLRHAFSARDAESSQVESVRRCEWNRVRWSWPHEVWAFGKQKFQINYRGDELDRASVKAVGKLLDSSLSITVNAIRQGRAIRRPDYTSKLSAIAQ